jgi:AraC family transcriptional regulator
LISNTYNEVGSAGSDAVTRIARWFRREPTSVLRGPDNSLYAAKWRFPANRKIATECVLDHTICFNPSGAGLVSKLVDGRATRRQTLPGSTTFVPVGEAARYTLERESTAVEVYISPALVERFTRECADAVSSVSIEPFFAVDDPWLKGYFQMLTAEMDVCAAENTRIDSLLLAQSQQLLVGYLLRRYSNLTKRGLNELARASVVRPLRPHLLGRVTDFVQENLSADIRLADLAALAHLSQRHFIRAFRAATGITPYQYVLEHRLRVAAQLLQLDGGRSVAEIARAAGFRSQSHFAAEFRARYRVTPRSYRRLHLGQ